MYWVTPRHIRVIIAAVEKQEVLHIVSVFVALGIQHANPTRPTILPYGLSVCTKFFTLSHKEHGVRGGGGGGGGK
jgi:hypothetical protein